MELSLSAAARATGRSKSTIGRAIKSGKISVRRDEAGGYRIDASELARAFDWDPREQVSRSATAPLGPASAPPGAASGVVAVLETKVAMLEQALDRERETTADLRQRLDRADERVRALLGSVAAAPPPAARRGFLARLLGR